MELIDYEEWFASFPHELRDCLLRLWWADNDGLALHDEVRSFIASKPHTVHVTFDGRRHRAAFRRLIESSEESRWFDRFAQLLGSFLDNNRAALNYLVYQLALRAVDENPSLLADGPLPESVEFPIFSDETAFNKKNRVKRLPTLGRPPSKTSNPTRPNERDFGCSMNWLGCFGTESCIRFLCAP
jgi:hypothetical protein